MTPSEVAKVAESLTEARRRMLASAPFPTATRSVNLTVAKALNRRGLVKTCLVPNSLMRAWKLPGYELTRSGEAVRDYLKGRP